MACSRCGDDCTCACSGNPLPQLDWRTEISRQVSAHRARRKPKGDRDAPLLDFEEQNHPPADQAYTPRVPASAWWTQAPVEPPPTRVAVRDPFADEPPPAVREQPPVQQQVVVEHEPEPYVAPEMRPPLPPFPRVSRRAPKKIIEFPRLAPQAYEVADPVADQLRIFEAEELPPPPSHFADIEIAPEEPAHLIAPEELELPLQPAPLAARSNAAFLDALVIGSASALFAGTAKVFIGSLGFSKPMIAASGACWLLLLSIYYLLSFSYSRTTVGMQATGLWLSTFSGDRPSRTALRCRALAIALSCAALGMGFAWSLIDEDRLCWHDRITHTYLRQG